MCMGSSLGPTMANFALDMIERQFRHYPIFYCRYVDDIFAIFSNKNEADEYLKHINSFHPNLQFTIEHSINNYLNFLDVTIEVINDKITTKWHIKRTNTGVYLCKTAYSPIQYKTAAIRALIYRAFRLSTSVEGFNESYDIIQSIFISNGYHFKFIQKIKDQVLFNMKSVKSKDKDEKKAIYYKLPYIKQLETYNKNCFRKINQELGHAAKVHLSYNTFKTSNFFANKDKLVNSVKSNIVYQFECKHCGACYTGETIRHLSTRANEHITGKTADNEVSMHVHPPTIDSFHIAMQTPHTKIGEAIIYKKVQPEKRLNQNNPPFNLQLFK